jgi:hypothetical protein
MMRTESRRSFRRSVFLAAVSLTLPIVSGCGGGGGGGSPTSTPTPVVTMISGTTTSAAPGSCSADVTHDFQVAAGTTFQVTLDASGDAAGLMVQVCAGGIDNNDCTVNLQSIAVGASRSGVRKGGESQNVKFLRRGCAGTDPFVAGPTTFSATVSYMRP